MMKPFLMVFVLILVACSDKPRETSTSEVSSKSDNTKNLLQLTKINCDEESTESTSYTLNCKNFIVSNTLIEGSDQNRYELITFVFDDIEKAIIRKINNEDLETSSPIVYFQIPLKTISSSFL
ncbi:hypothetical protein J2799_000278 [Chryseobacterium vietnamense]|uniref:hypothetical protein n=1 Tax=Chryseobacterium vietnamense TaxID=866785 RepID=UPI0028617170|nr:hypothetical protein [Chryseobacterium vietnamense]MDR6485793.1 hypothetical protein [Chryseobacterium vietnamense]